MAKKKGKKGKKEKVSTGPTPVTTIQIIHDRTKMLCPRMGDYYERNEQVELILEVKEVYSAGIQVICIYLYLGCGRKVFIEDY
jgi:hypothetical protein